MYRDAVASPRNADRDNTAPNRGGVCNPLLLLLARLWRQTARSVRVAAACCRGVSIGGVCRCLCGLHRRASTPRHPLSTSTHCRCTVPILCGRNTCTPLPMRAARCPLQLSPAAVGCCRWGSKLCDCARRLAVTFANTSRPRIWCCRAAISRPARVYTDTARAHNELSCAASCSATAPVSGGRLCCVCSRITRSGAAAGGWAARVFTPRLGACPHRYLFCAASAHNYSRLHWQTAAVGGQGFPSARCRWQWQWLRAPTDY